MTLLCDELIGKILMMRGEHPLATIIRQHNEELARMEAHREEITERALRRESDGDDYEYEGWDDNVWDEFFYGHYEGRADEES